jgi:hypothetical protein
MSLILQPQCCCPRCNCENLKMCFEWDEDILFTRDIEVITAGITDTSCTGCASTLNGTFLYTGGNANFAYSDIFGTGCLLTAGDDFGGLVDCGGFQVSMLLNLTLLCSEDEDHSQLNLQWQGTLGGNNIQWSLSGVAAETAINALCAGSIVSLPFLSEVHAQCNHDGTSPATIQLV